MTESKVLGLFAVADIPVTHHWKAFNGYYSGRAWPNPDHDEDWDRNTTWTSRWCCVNPWWTVVTPWGPVNIGWRKRVIVIDWRATKVRTIVTEDNVTKSPSDVHAWSEEDVVKYLKALKKAFTDERFARPALFKECLEKAAWRQGYLIQNIPPEVLSDALTLWDRREPYTFEQAPKAPAEQEAHAD